MLPLNQGRPRNFRVICSRAVRVRINRPPRKGCASSLSQRQGIKPHPRASTAQRTPQIGS